MHIFISYAKVDTRDLAIQLRDAFTALPGVTAWMDVSLYSGEDWATQIQNEIDRADLVIVLLSPDVNRPANDPKGQSFVLKEIHYAQQNKKMIIPVMAINAHVPMLLSGIEYINFASNPVDGLQRLLSEITARVGTSASVMLPSTKLEEKHVSPAHLIGSSKLTTYRIPLIVGLSAVILLAIVTAMLLPHLSQETPETPSQNTTEIAHIASTGTYLREAQTTISNFRKLMRPIIVSGASIGSPQSTAGTLGVFVRDTTGTIYFLTGTAGKGGGSVLQPGPIDGGIDPQDKIGEWMTPPDPDNTIAKLTNLVRLVGEFKIDTTIPMIGDVKGIQDQEQVTVGENIRKVARTTGYTEGIITKVNSSVQINIASDQTVLLTGAYVTGSISAGGDSGALVVNSDNYAIGLVIGGDNSNATIIIPIRRILDFYGVRLCMTAEDCPWPNGA